MALNELKELLLLTTKNVRFSFNGQFYLQKDGVANGSPLGPVIAGIFMVELERSLLPKLSSYMTYWKRYVMTLLPTLNRMLLTMFCLF